MKYLQCSKCGKNVRIQSRNFFLNEGEIIECLNCNPNQKGFVCNKCGDMILFTKSLTGKNICKSCIAKKTNSNPETKKKISEAIKKRFSSMSEEDRKSLLEKQKDSWTEEKRKKQSDLQKSIWIEEKRKEASEKKSGSKNAMYGRSVFSTLVEKYGEKKAKILFNEMIERHKESFRKNHSTEEKKKELAEKTSHLGKTNGMHGRSVYEVWIEKYGKEEADRKLENLKRKTSEKSKGKNNPMYGKPAPIGSGNGISGWYKGWYFRSLRELSYMINVIEKEEHTWRSLDNTSDFRIKYIDKNCHERSYCPDFLIDDKIVVEIKPKKLQGLENVLRKENAAILYCKSRNMEYIKIDAEILDFSIIEEMINNGKIKLTEKSFEKFLRFKTKHNRMIKQNQRRITND